MASAQIARPGVVSACPGVVLERLGSASHDGAAGHDPSGQRLDDRDAGGPAERVDVVRARQDFVAEVKLVGEPEAIERFSTTDSVYLNQHVHLGVQ